MKCYWKLKFIEATAFSNKVSINSPLLHNENQKRSHTIRHWHKTKSQIVINTFTIQSILLIIELKSYSNSKVGQINETPCIFTYGVLWLCPLSVL